MAPAKPEMDCGIRGQLIYCNGPGVPKMAGVEMKTEVARESAAPLQIVAPS